MRLFLQNWRYIIKRIAHCFYMNFSLVYFKIITSELYWVFANCCYRWMVSLKHFHCISLLRYFTAFFHITPLRSTTSPQIFFIYFFHINPRIVLVFLTIFFDFHTKKVKSLWRSYSIVASITVYEHNFFLMTFPWAADFCCFC